MISYNRNGVEIREAHVFDVTILKGHLRPADVAEVWASDHDSPGKALNDSFNLSRECYTLTRHGNPIAMFGIVPLKADPDRAVVWLLGSEDITRIKKTFVALTLAVLRHFLTLYPVLFNFVDVRYEKAIRWLSLCGASFGEPQPYGKAGLPFKPFVIRRPKWEVLH